MFLKINHDKVVIKGRGCAFGSNQQNWIYKEYTTSPTVYTEGLMLACMIKEIEARDVGNPRSLLKN